MGVEQTQRGHAATFAARQHRSAPETIVEAGITTIQLRIVRFSRGCNRCKLFSSHSSGSFLEPCLAPLGVGLGMAYVAIFKVSSFEGYSGSLVFLTFMPLGAIAGGIGGAILLGMVGAKK
jgi:hypothetical protein